LKKVPVCFSYAFCDLRSEDENEELIVFTDPTNLEERVIFSHMMCYFI